MSVSYSGGRPHRPSRRRTSRRETTTQEDVDPASQRLPVGIQGPHDQIAQQPFQQQQAIRHSIPTPGPDIVSRYPIYHSSNNSKSIYLLARRFVKQSTNSTGYYLWR